MRQREHILVVSWWFPPRVGGGVYRPLNFVRHLHRRGFRITVLTGTMATGEVGDPGLLERVPEGVRILRAPHLDPFRWYGRLRGWLGRGEGRGAPFPSTAPVASEAAAGPPTVRLKDWISEGMMVPDRWQSWVIPATLHAAARLAGDEPDLIFATSPPHSLQLVALRLKSMFQCPLVADLRDPWVANPFRRFSVPALWRIDEAMERRVIHGASEVVCNTPALERDFRQRYPDRDTFRTITNGFDPDQFDAALPLSPPAAGEPLQIVHLGQLYGLRSGRYLLRGLALLRNRDAESFAGLQVRLIGGIDRGTGFFEELDAIGDLPCLKIEGSVSHAEALEFQREAHALLILGVENDEPEVQVPGKLYEYFAAGKPVLSLSRAGGAIRDVLDQSGVLCEQAEPSDAEDIAGALSRLCRRLREGSDETAGGDTASFRYDRLTDRLVRCFEDALRVPVG